MSEKRGNEVFGGAFLIGMAVLFLLNWWWPGMMFVIGIAMLARAVASGRNWMDERGGLAVLAIGVVFTLIGFISNLTFNWWPLILILLGLYLLFGNRRRWNGGSNSNSGEKEKPKNDDFV